MVRRFFRCYEAKSRCTAPGAYYCEAMKLLDEVEADRVTDPGGSWHWRSWEASAFPWDAFPTVCDACRRELVEPERQIFTEHLWRRTDTGEIFGDRNRPIGAMWDDEHLRGGSGGFRDGPLDIGYTGPDGMALSTQLPDGGWSVDSQASNCTKPQRVWSADGSSSTFTRSHFCWCRHGDPKTGYVHIDKDDPNTCAAGAGSIWQNMPNGFHGFVYRGFVIDCDGKGAVDQMLDRPGTRLPVAERVLKVHQIDMPAAVRATRERPVPYWLKPKRNQGSQRRGGS